MLLTLLFISSQTHANLPPQHNTYATQLIEQIAGPDSSAAYQSLSPKEKTKFLKTFWQNHNPLIYKYYYGHLFGQQRYSVSDSYFERNNVLPEVFHTGAQPPDSLHIAQAKTIFQTLVDQYPNDPVALNALGYALLEADETEAAEPIFLKAVEKDRKLAVARNGRGLAFLKIPKKRNLALKQFQTAAAQDRKYEAASYNQALYYIAVDGKDLPFYFKQTLKNFPKHPDAHFKLGVLYEPEEPKKSLESFSQQIQVNPKHHGAYLGKGRVLLALNRPKDAISTWQNLLEVAPTFRPQILSLMLKAYQKSGDTAEALSVASKYIRTLDEESQQRFRDIRLIASAEEKETYLTLPPEDRAAFELAFWQKRDPTPATRGNERLVEHYRRVLYAIDNFSEHIKPWDKRGDVYIRYGEPAHISKHNNVRFEFHPRVIKVKERLWKQIPETGRIEIIARMSRLRSSTRDVLDGQAGDFESIDYELNPNSSGVRQARDPAQVTSTERQPSSIFEQTKDNYNISHRDRGAGTETIRGFPIYPIDGDKPWEYWIYTDIGDGFEVVFASLTKGGDFDFPLPPGDRAQTQQNAPMWTQRLPERVYASAVKKQSDVYRLDGDPIAFYFDHANFRSDAKRSRLEVYYGIPLKDLSPPNTETATVERGIAIFDTAWKPLLQKTEPLAYTPQIDPTSDLLIIDQLALNLPPGEYILGVEARDPNSGNFGSYTQKIEVPPYPPSDLKLSTLQLASQVTEKSDHPLKGGHIVSPLPSRAYAIDQPVTVYYEIYGLTKNDFGQTNYRLDLQIFPIKKGDLPAVNVLHATGKLLGIKTEAAVTISYEQLGTQTTEQNYLEIDLEKTKPAEYKLILTITDQTTNATTTQETTFHIVK